MVGLQWCDNCGVPRFRWNVRDLERVREECWSCGRRVQARFVGDGFADLRRQLSEWAVGGRTQRIPLHAHRRRDHVRDKFDVMVRYFEKQEDNPPELKRLLTEYHNRGQKAPAWTPPAVPAEKRNAPLVEPGRLHDLAEGLRPLAMESRAERERTKPTEVVGRPGAWKMVPRPTEQPTDAAPSASDSDTLTGVYVGGPRNGEEFPVRADLCIIVGKVVPKIRAARENWVALDGNGEAVVMQGGQRTATEWISFVADYYRQDGKPQAGRVTYTYERTVKVTRCEAVTKKGGRCRHEAFEGFTSCGQHKSVGRPLPHDDYGPEVP